MNDLATLTAQPKPLVVDGETYMVHPLNLTDWGSMQGWLDAQFPNPIDLAYEAMGRLKLSVPMQQFMLKTAMELAAKGRRLIGTPEADEKLESLEGYAQLLWTSIRKGKPDFSEADAAALCRKMTLGHFAQLRAATNAEMVLSDPKAPPAETAGATP